MKKLVIAFLLTIGCLMAFTTTTYAEEVETTPETEEKIDIEGMINALDEKIEYLKEQKEKIEESQTYAVIMMIVSLVVSVGYSFTSITKRIKTLKASDKSINDNTDEVKALKEEVEALQMNCNQLIKIVGDYAKGIDGYKEDMDSIKEIVKIGFCNDRDAVIDGRAERISKIAEEGYGTDES